MIAACARVCTTVAQMPVRRSAFSGKSFGEKHGVHVIFESFRKNITSMRIFTFITPSGHFKKKSEFTVRP